MTIALITIAALIAAAIDAKHMDSHRLAVSRLYRKIRKVQRANEQTELDCMYYRQQVGK